MQHFANASDAKLVAQGIENEADLLVVRDIGIGCGQGYFFSRPHAQPHIAVFPETTRSVSAAPSGGCCAERWKRRTPLHRLFRLARGARCRQRRQFELPQERIRSWIVGDDRAHAKARRSSTAASTLWRETRLRQTSCCVVCICDHATVNVRYGGYLASAVPAEFLRLAQRIGLRDWLSDRAVGVARDVAFRIGVTKQVAVAVPNKARHAAS
jgi:hypothetical protein